MKKERLLELAGITESEQLDESTFDVDRFAVQLANDFAQMWDTSDKALERFIKKEGKSLIKQVKKELRQKVKDRLEKYTIDGKQRDFYDVDRDF